MRRHLIRASLAAAILAVSAAGYSYSTFARWASVPVTLFVNPANADVTPGATITALQHAMNVWTSAGSSFAYQYGGPVSDTTTGFDQRNVMIFRNVNNGSTIATTYSWWDSSQRLLDSDIVVWDARFTFYTGTSGCGAVSDSAYLEDIAVHEFGHALGLSHSSFSDASMYPSYGFCSQAFRSLAPDDLAGVRALYPGVVANTPPMVTILAPANGASFPLGANVSFTASASDTQDGNLTSRIQWTDNGTAIGSGGLVSRVLSVLGTHVIVARVTDNGSLQGSSEVSIIITATSGTPTPTLSAVRNGSGGMHRVTLSWSGISGALVDLYRNGTRVTTTTNDGAHSDHPGTKSPTAATYTYRVCSAGTATCTNTVSVSF